MKTASETPENTYAHSAGRGFAEGASSYFSEAAQNSGLSEHIRHVVSEFFREIGENLASGMRGAGKSMTDAIGEVTNSLFRELTLNSVPYIASALFAICGAPLGAFYLYRRAIHQLERPKLIAEEHLVGKLDRIQNRIKAVALGSLQALTSGIKWSATVGFLATTAYLPTLIGYQLWSQPTYREFLRFDDAYRTFGMLGTAGAAGAALLSTAGRNIYSWAQKTLFAKPDPKPIFDEALTERIQDIGHHIRNLRKHGGDLQNVLLYGPGGTGKTMVAKMIAKQSGFNYIFMSGGDLAQYIQRGEHVTQLKKLFEHIHSCHTPTILFIDEMESLCGKRDHMDPAHLELLNAFLSFTGEPSKQFMLIGATNMPKLLDEAVLNRMDHKLEIAPPKPAQRRAILEQYISRFFTSKEAKEYFTPTLLDEITEKTSGLTGRTLRKFINMLSSKKMATDENKLTEEMILDELNLWVNQESALKSATA